MMSNVPSFAELLNDLFRRRRRPDGREYTYMEVALALDGAIEPAHLSRLRNGKIANPGREAILALCRFFEVAPAYFFPELAQTAGASAVPEQDALRAALRSAGIVDSDVLDRLAELIGTLARKVA